MTARKLYVVPQVRFDTWPTTLGIIASAPPTLTETPLERARRIYGKPFAHKNPTFVWSSEPRVLDEWLERRRKELA